MMTFILYFALFIILWMITALAYLDEKPGKRGFPEPEPKRGQELRMGNTDDNESRDQHMNTSITREAVEEAWSFLEERSRGQWLPMSKLDLHDAIMVAIESAPLAKRDRGFYDEMIEILDSYEGLNQEWKRGFLTAANAAARLVTERKATNGR